jgi:hypothetical protein
VDVFRPPNVNRLVACSLESEWNEKLQALSEAHREYESQKQRDELMLSDQHKMEIEALSKDFPRLWNDPQTPARERKRLVRLIVESVTLFKGEHVQIDVCFKGGAIKSISVPRALNAGLLRKTAPNVVQDIDRLLDTHVLSDIAKILNKRGLLSGEGKPFTKSMLSHICQNYGLKEHRLRQLESGKLSRKAISDLLKLPERIITKLGKEGYLRKCGKLFEKPTKEEIKTIRSIKPSKTGRPPKSSSLHTQ